MSIYFYLFIFRIKFFNTGKELLKNKVLTVIPNNGEGTFNYAQPVPGSLFKTLHQRNGIKEGTIGNKLSNVAVITCKRMNVEKFWSSHKNHFSDAKSAAEELKKNQEYIKKIKTKYENYEKSKKVTQNKIPNQIIKTTNNMISEVQQLFQKKLNQISKNENKTNKNLSKKLISLKQNENKKHQSTVNQIKK